MSSSFKSVAIFGLFFTPSLHAQSLLEAFDYAKQNNQNYQSTRAQHRATLEKKPQAYSYLYPNISARIAQTNTSNDRTDTDDTTARITLTQPLFNKATWHGLAQAQKAIDSSTLNLEQAEKKLILDVVNAYFSVLQSAESVAVIESEAKAIDQQLSDIKQKFDVGLTSINDLNNAQAKKDIAQSDILLAKTQLIIAKEKLEQLTHQNSHSLLSLQSNIPLLLPEPNDVDWWINTAYKKNTAIKLKQVALENAQEAIGFQRAGHYPTLDLTATLSDVQASNAQINEGRSTSVGLTLNIPIFSGGMVSSKVSEARHNYDAAKINLDQERRNAKSRVRELFYTVVSNVRQIQATEQSLKSAQIAYDTEVISFEAGVRTSTDVLNARSQLSSTKLNLVKLKYAYLSNVLNLKQAAGVLDRKDLQTTNQLLIQR